MAALKISEVEMASYYHLNEACLLLKSTVKSELAPEILNSVSTKSISKHLKKQFVYLADAKQPSEFLQQIVVTLYDLYSSETVYWSQSGRSKNDAVILTFPECASFCAVSNEVVERVLVYLTTISSLHKTEVKFTVVLDRRLDSWASVKAALGRIAE